MTENIELFKIGDVVQLKSGGPLMTIRSILNKNDAFNLGNDDYACQWFDDKNTLITKPFIHAALKQIKE